MFDLAAGLGERQERWVRPRVLRGTF